MKKNKDDEKRKTRLRHEDIRRWKSKTKKLRGHTNCEPDVNKQEIKTFSVDVI